MKKRKKNHISGKRAATLTVVPDKSGQPEKRFLLQKLLGSGGMCAVYAATDLFRLGWSDKNPQVALKLLLPELSDNKQAQLALAQEYFTLRNLSHPGIVRAYDLHQGPAGVCYSMEILQGRSLSQAQSDEPAGYGKEGARLAAGLFDALAYLHGNGVIHADIKPANLFESAGSRLIIIDFNTARIAPKPGSASSSAVQGLRENFKFPAYSLLHASPERLESGQPSTADDIFSACCTVYELIEGRHPFGRKSSLEAQKENMKPQKPGGISSSQWKALAAGLSFTPAQRPDAEALHQTFAKVSNTKYFHLFPR